jgi:hypothetical protein
VRLACGRCRALALARPARSPSIPRVCPSATCLLFVSIVVDVTFLGLNGPGLFNALSASGPGGGVSTAAFGAVMTILNLPVKLAAALLGYAVFAEAGGRATLRPMETSGDSAYASLGGGPPMPPPPAPGAGSSGGMPSVYQPVP